MFFSDLHVALLSRGILNPGERVLGQTVTSYMPWWAFGFIRRQYLVFATDQRLIMLDHRFGIIQPTTQRLHAADSLTWGNVQEAKVTGLFMKKKLKVRGVGERGPVALKMVISNGFFGLLAPMKNNMQGARAVAAAAAQAMQGGAPQLSALPVQHAAQLPAPAPYGVAAPGNAQLGAYGQAPMPHVNAPGYQSVAPPAPAQAPTGPVASPFDPPRQY